MLQATNTEQSKQKIILTLTKNNMERYTLKSLKNLVKNGDAIDVTRESKRNAIPERYTQIGYSAGLFGCNGMLLQGESGQLYAVTARSVALYVF